MKIKFKLSFWLIIVLAAAAIIVTIIVLRQASDISYFLSVRSLSHLTSQRVEFWKGREDGYLRTLRTLANVMGDYESVRAEERRDRYDDMLKSALEAEPQMVSLYTVWKPNAIDDMDSRFIGRLGSSPTGQYAISYFKETTNITGRTSGDIESITAHINGPNAHKDRVENPSILKIKGKDTYIIKLAVPIINHRTNKVVGALGCYLTVDAIQQIVENTMKTNDEIAVMAMYSGNGTILAHYKPERIGKRMLDVDTELGGSRQDMFRAMQAGKPYMSKLYRPGLKEKVLYIMKPFQIGNSGHNWAMLIGIPESFFLKEVKAITRFTITLVTMAFLITAAVVFVIIVIFTKPIARITDKLKEISEGTGDLTRFIPEDGNDEITDLSHCFNLTQKKIRHLVIIIKQQAAVLSDIDDELSGNLSIITEEIKDMSAGSEQINTAVTRANEISEKNKINIDVLARGVSMFKVA